MLGNAQILRQLCDNCWVRQLLGATIAVCDNFATIAGCATIAGATIVGLAKCWVRKFGDSCWVPQFCDNCLVLQLLGETIAGCDNCWVSQLLGETIWRQLLGATIM